ncbi:hypothetical protein C0Z23_21950 [Salmonella enterica]|nr:hypothetical protein [Salmonella enterica]
MNDSKEKPLKLDGNLLAYPSKNTNCQRKLSKKRSQSGLRQFKLYFGQDLIEKLSIIYQHQYGEELVIKDRKPKDIDGIAGVLGYCVNQVFTNNKVFKEGQYKKIKRIPPANTPLSQEIYELHQIVSMRFNALNEEDSIKQRLRSVKYFMNEKGYPSLTAILNPKYSSKSANVFEWTESDIETLLDINKVFSLIKEKNSKK